MVIRQRLFRGQIMRINQQYPINNYPQNLNQKGKTTESFETEEVKNTQNIKLEANTEINLGKLNGKPFMMKVFKEGGIQWSGGGLIPPELDTPPGTPVREEVKAIVRAREAYSKCEREIGEKNAAIINQFYMITDRGYSADYFNEYIENNPSEFKSSDVLEALKRLGIDGQTPFTINNRTFMFDGELKEIKTS